MVGFATVVTNFPSRWQESRPFICGNSPPQLKHVDEFARTSLPAAISFCRDESWLIASGCPSVRNSFPFPLWLRVAPFISLKDHKENFENNPKCRLINPAKSESGKLSKIILDKVNSNLRKILNLNQWKNTQNVIEWFGNIKEKHRYSFISFDIVDFYPSISENLLDQALSWASNLAIITKDEISIIKHARKSVLFNDGKPWTKKDSNSLFDVIMGSYDGAEICELVGLFILNKLGQKFGKENIGLYRDDGLAIMKSKSARLADKTRKELHKCFEQFGLKITAEAN